MPSRIGILGGSFDPPHLGHLAVGVESAHRLDLDVVHVMVANDPWQKSTARSVTPAALRWEMVQAACAGHPRLFADDAELRRGGVTYSIDTVTALVAEGCEVTLLLGDDAAAGVETWHRAQELAELVTLGVVGRPDSPVAEPPERWRVRRIECPAFEISSTDIRRRCAAGEPIDHLVPPGVLAVIDREALYGFGR